MAKRNSRASKTSVVSNAEIADKLMSVAQLLSVHDGNYYKIKAYRRAAANIRLRPESLADMVRSDADLTRFRGIGKAIASAIREIVLTGHLRNLETMLSEASPEAIGLTRFPRLDPRRVARVYKKLGISTVEALRDKLESGDIASRLGVRMAQHVRLALSEMQPILLHKADDLRVAIEEFLWHECGVAAVQVAGDYRRRVEIVEEIAFVVQTNDFRSMVAKLERYGGSTPLLRLTTDAAEFALSSGIKLRVLLSPARTWGVSLIAHTGSAAHLEELETTTGGIKSLTPTGVFATEQAVYGELGLSYIEPELREGHGETDRAKQGTPVALVSVSDIRGNLHANSTSSDGRHSIEQMAIAAGKRGYEYIGITDHSQSLKFASGVPAARLWDQIRYIDSLNERLANIRVFKSSEVDILADGSLDYPNELLRELDYTVCSIHSAFALSREKPDRAHSASDGQPVFQHPRPRHWPAVAQAPRLRD